MVPRRTDTKRQILDIAEELWLQRGYNGFSYQHISGALGVKNAAIHYHYPSKGDLGVALVERMTSRFERWARRMDASERGFWDKLDAFFEIYEGYLEDDGKVCPAGILEAEFRTISDGMQAATRKLINTINSWLTELVAEGRGAGDIAFRGEPRGIAAIIAASVQGALQVSRVAGRKNFDVVVEHIKLQLTMGLPTPTPAT